MFNNGIRGELSICPSFAEPRQINAGDEEFSFPPLLFGFANYKITSWVKLPRLTVLQWCFDLIKLFLNGTSYSMCLSLCTKVYLQLLKKMLEGKAQISSHAKKSTLFEKVINRLLWGLESTTNEIPKFSIVRAICCCRKDENKRKPKNQVKNRSSWLQIRKNK